VSRRERNAGTLNYWRGVPANIGWNAPTDAALNRVRYPRQENAGT
jgi:hypothetical protein